MDEKKYLSIQQICHSYQVSPSLLVALEEYELIEIEYTNQEGYLGIDELAKLERLLRLNQDLDINVAGLCVVHELLEERKRLREELNRLQRQMNRLSIF
ncbi:chaperone modulator CbpM [Lewinella cohaerens]|uniref:chaperone modulator CbpM n=1 Tax=Lewinella cohaerens TaxID=70995 RepID=UPI0003764204|nr:chaperone modulator CbpM [Lewinella cohaerens]